MKESPVSLIRKQRQEKVGEGGGEREVSSVGNISDYDHTHHISNRCLPQTHPLQKKIFLNCIEVIGQHDLTL